MTGMTNQQGAPEALRPIARYKIGYATDDWGMRSSTPSGIPDPAGAWVRYEDHLAALVEAQQPAPSAAADLIAALEEARSAINSMKVEAETAGQGDEQMMLEACETISNEGLQADMAIRAALASAPRPAPSAAVALSDDLRDRLVAISEAVADQDDRAAQAMLREILAAPQPSPTPQADSQPALPKITAEDRSFLHYNPNTDDVVEWVCRYASAAITADRAARAPAESVTAPAATPTAASIAWTALRDLTDPLGEAGVKIMGHVRIYAQRQYEAGLTEGRATPPAQAANSVLEDAARLDWLDQQCEAYGFQDIHEGNRWEIGGAYANVRDAIDAERAARKHGCAT